MQALGILKKKSKYAIASTTSGYKGGRVGIWVPAHWGRGEIDGLLVSPGKASKLLTDHLSTGQSFKSEPAQEKWFCQTIHTYTCDFYFANFQFPNY